MGSSHSVPHEGGERLSDYLRRVFEGKPSDLDKLVVHALKEEHKQQRKAEKKEKVGFWKRIKNKFKAADKDNKNEKGSDPGDVQADMYDFMTDRRNRGKKKAKKENKDSDKENLLQWRNHQENVINSTRATATDRREPLSYSQHDPIPSTSSSAPRRFLRSGDSPVYQFNIPLNIVLPNPEARSVRDMGGATQPPWTHKYYGSEPWAEDTAYRPRRRETYGLNNNDTYGYDLPYAVKEDTYARRSHNYDALNRVREEEIKPSRSTSGRDTHKFEYRDDVNRVQEQDISLPQKEDNYKRPEQSSVDSSENIRVQNYSPASDHRYKVNEQEISYINVPRANENSQRLPKCTEKRGVTSREKTEVFDVPATSDTKYESRHKAENIEREIETNRRDEKDKSTAKDNNTQTTNRKAEAFFVSFGQSGLYGAEDVQSNFDKRFPKMRNQDNDMAILKENKVTNRDDTITKTKTCVSAAENQTHEKTVDAFGGNSFDYLCIKSPRQYTNIKRKTDADQTENKGQKSQEGASRKRSERSEEVFVIQPFGDSDACNKNKYENTGTQTESGDVHQKRFDRGEIIEASSETKKKQAEAFFVSFGPSECFDKGQTEDMFPSSAKKVQNKEKQETAVAVNEVKKKADTFFISANEPSTLDQEKDCADTNKDNAKIFGETKHDVAQNSNQENTDKEKSSNTAEAFFVSFGPSATESNDSEEDVKACFQNRFPNKPKAIIDIDEMPIKPAPALFLSPGKDSEYGSSVEYYKKAGKDTGYGSVEHNNKIKTDNAMRKKKLGEIQTKVDSWKISDMRLVRKPAQYGSVEHNNLIQKDNALRKKKIESATTKVDSWKDEETDDSYLHPNMRHYKLASKPAQYGSVAHNNHIKGDNAKRKKKIGNITTTLDTWKTKESDDSYLLPNMRGFEVAQRPAEYGSVEHNNRIKKDNAMRKMRMGKIKSNLDTWNAPNPGSKYSIQRKDEWEPVYDPGKYGSVAHFHQIKSNNAMRKKRMNQIHSNLDTWNTKNPGSKYSMQRKDDWEPVYDTSKYGSVAHYHQVKQTHADNRYMLKKAGTRLSTWQAKSKMDLLKSQQQKKVETNKQNMHSVNASINSTRSKIDTGTNNYGRNDHNLSSWSRYTPAGKSRDYETRSDNEFSRTAMIKHVPDRTKPDVYLDLSSLDNGQCRASKRYISELNTEDNLYNLSPRSRNMYRESYPDNGHYQTPRIRHVTGGIAPANEHHQHSWDRPVTSRTSPAHRDYQPCSGRYKSHRSYSQSPWSRPVTCRTSGGKTSRIPVSTENPLSKYEETLRRLLRQRQK